MKTITLAALILFGMAGCATMGNYIESDVTVYHEVEPNVTPMTFAVLPWREELADSLQFRSFARIAEQALIAQGHQVASDPSQANYFLFLNYGIDDGTLVTSTYSIPQFGVTGYSGSTTTGTVSTVGNTSYINAHTTSTPTYGITGYHTGLASEQVYKRFVAIDILKVDGLGEPKKIYEAKLLSDGRCRNLSTLMPTFIRAVFADFPGESGASRNVVAPWDGRC